MPFTPTDLEFLRAEIQAFADERAWERFHTPRNLLLAVMSELGEAAEIVRWHGDSDPAIPPESQAHWNDEIADVAILLIRLADRSGVDLGTAIRSKLARAGEKYPVDRFHGSNRKYNAGAEPGEREGAR